MTKKPTPLKELSDWSFGRNHSVSTRTNRPAKGVGKRYIYQIFCHHQFTSQGENRGAGIVKMSIKGSGKGRRGKQLEHIEISYGLYECIDYMQRNY